MIKLVGFVFVVSAFTLCGFHFASRVEERHRQLKLVVKMLGEIKILLEYGVMTKGEIFSKIFTDENYIVFDIKNLSLSMLDDNEKQNLTDFYNQFGTTDLQGQLYTLEMYKNTFSESCEEHKALKDNKCRLMRTSGVLLGIFLCLMFI